MNLRIQFIALVALTLASCAPKSTYLSAPARPNPQAEVTMAVVPAKVTVQPKVDILFVIDTSESMDKHQENLKANIDRFVESFKANTEVDFHIGVVSIWDSVRYGHIVQPPYALGKLRPLKDPQNPGQAVAGPQYITRTDRFSEILGETLKLGIENRFGRDAKGRVVESVDAGGPEKEDSFTPVIPALKTNGDFYRPDAHLAVVFLTDADDQSVFPHITPDGLRNELVKMKGNQDLVSAYGAVAIDGCKTDPDLEQRDARGRVINVLRPENIISFTEQTGGSIMNLCNDQFGDELARIGKIIELKTMHLIQVPLPVQPEPGTLRVMYNGVRLSPGEAWSRGNFNGIQIHGDADVFTQHPGGELSIEYVPVDYKRVAQGKVANP